jgi:hypothetical protein
MASRFTSARAEPRATSDAASDSETLLSRPAAKPEDPAEAAAKIGMFGPMTRSTISFYPSRLLCKRFNVRPPAHVQVDPGEFPGERDVSTGGRFQSAGYQAPTGIKELVSKEVMNQLMLEAGGGNRLVPATSAAEAQPSTQAPRRQQIVIEPERNDALEAERPGEAVFKAVFGSDDEDEAE